MAPKKRIFYRHDMSNEEYKKERDMKQRIITGVLLTTLLAAFILLPPVCLAVFVLTAISLCMWEEFHAMKIAGHRPVSWPTWAGLAFGLLLNSLVGISVHYTLVILATVFLITAVCVIFREEPKLVDLSMSILPALSVLLPGMCLTVLSLEKNRSIQLTMMIITFAVPVVGDTAAYFGGKSIGGRKLCPAVSPNKTVAGSICGLLGSTATALLIMLVTHLYCSGETLAMLPNWYQYLFLGFAGGFVGQVGDLFASLVKRHSGIKDFSNLFPGHGGMLDRSDSILFTAVFVYCFRLFH